MNNPEPYSRGIRQKVYRLYASHPDFYLNRGVGAKTGEMEYAQELCSSVFCLAMPGDGWSPRVNEAMRHGCIPVIIMDETLQVGARGSRQGGR